jgi:hypothetical protein
MDIVPVWVNLLNPVRRLTNSADCNQHRARLCANGRFWRKADKTVVTSIWLAAGCEGSHNLIDARFELGDRKRFLKKWK